MNITQPIIRVENVSKEFSLGTTVVRALRGISIEIPRGAFQFVVGPSGSGKSTLLYLLGALDRPSGGSIEVVGQRIEDMSASEQDHFRRHEVGFIFQSFNLLSNLSALDNVLAPFIPSGVPPRLRERARALLKQVGLGERMAHRPQELSGGEQQRVAIARALLKEPALVLADEPTGELDSNTGDEIFGYLRNLGEAHGTTVVVVTHDQSYIMPNDRVLTLRDGQVLEN